MKLLATMTAVAVLSYSAAAFDKAQKKPEQTTPAIKESPAKDANADKPKPSAEMKRLSKALGGRWQVEEKYEVTPFTPQGGEGKGTEIVHRGPGGLSLLLNYSSNSPMGEYHGFGIIAWSPEQSAYQEYWVDSGAPGGEVWTGKWEGDSLIFTTTQKMGDKTINWKQTLTGLGNDVFTVTFDMGSAQNESKSFMTFKFTRMAKQNAGTHRHGTGMHGRPSPDNGWAPRAELSGLPRPRS